jgi:excisionase family DNA binding protein
MEGVSGTTQPLFGMAQGPLAVDVKEAALMLGICSKTLRREIARGELASVRIGKAVRIRVIEIHAYLKRKERKITI